MLTLAVSLWQDVGTVLWGSLAVFAAPVAVFAFAVLLCRGRSPRR